MSNFSTPSNPNELALFFILKDSNVVSIKQTADEHAFVFLGQDKDGKTVNGVKISQGAYFNDTYLLDAEEADKVYSEIFDKQKKAFDEYEARMAEQKKKQADDAKAKAGNKKFK